MEGWVASPVQGHEIARMEALAEPVAPPSTGTYESTGRASGTPEHWHVWKHWQSQWHPRALAEPMAPHSYSGTPEKEN
jgi:hypothetical protein